MKPTIFLTAAVALCLAATAALPAAARDEAHIILKKKDFKKRVINPRTDHVNTLGASIERIYMERTFCMINFLLPPGEDPAAASADFYIEVPATEKFYRTRATGGSHLVAHQLRNDGRIYLAVTFEGIPEDTRLVNVHLPATATHFTGVHLFNDTAAAPAAADIVVEKITEQQSAVPTPAADNRPAASGDTPAATGDKGRKKAFTSPDLSLYDLCGHVKTCITYGADGNVAERLDFSREGALTAVGGTPVEQLYAVERDGRGHIMALTAREASHDGSHDCTTYRWTPGGRVLSATWESAEGESTRSYIYDRFGALVSQRESGFQGDTVDSHYTYEYLGVDERERANWTERRVSLKEADGTVTQWTERRSITYYE